VSSILIEGGTRIDVVTGTSALGDLLIRDGVVVGLGAVDTTEVDDRFDATGMYVSPGWIDGHSRGWSGSRSDDENLRPDRRRVPGPDDRGRLNACLRRHQPRLERCARHRGRSLIALGVRLPRGDRRDLASGKTYFISPTNLEAFSAEMERRGAAVLTTR